MHMHPSMYAYIYIYIYNNVSCCNILPLHFGYIYEHILMCMLAVHVLRSQSWKTHKTTLAANFTRAHSHTLQCMYMCSVCLHVCARIHTSFNTCTSVKFVCIYVRAVHGCRAQGWKATRDDTYRSSSDWIRCCLHAWRTSWSAAAAAAVAGMCMYLCMYVCVYIYKSFKTVSQPSIIMRIAEGFPELTHSRSHEHYTHTHTTDFVTLYI
jgi:hypothetical protein